MFIKLWKTSCIVKFYFYFTEWQMQVLQTYKERSMANILYGARFFFKVDTGFPSTDSPFLLIFLLPMQMQFFHYTSKSSCHQSPLPPFPTPTATFDLYRSRTCSIPPPRFSLPPRSSFVSCEEEIRRDLKLVMHDVAPLWSGTMISGEGDSRSPSRIRKSSSGIWSVNKFSFFFFFSFFF